MTSTERKPIILDLSLNPRGVWELPRTGTCGHPTFEQPERPGTYRCPQCKAATDAAWQARNRDRMAATGAAWAARNRERRAASSDAWRARNPEKVMQDELNRERI